MPVAAAVDKNQRRHIRASLPADGAGRHRIDPMSTPRVIALPMGEFTFRPEDPWPGQTGVVVAYAIRHSGGVFLFDTGIGIGNEEFDRYYMVRARPLPEILAEAGVDEAE